MIARRMGVLRMIWKSCHSDNFQFWFASPTYVVSNAIDTRTPLAEIRYQGMMTKNYVILRYVLLLCVIQHLHWVSEGEFVFCFVHTWNWGDWLLCVLDINYLITTLGNSSLMSG